MRLSFYQGHSPLGTSDQILEVTRNCFAIGNGFQDALSGFRITLIGKRRYVTVRKGATRVSCRASRGEVSAGLGSRVSLL